MIQQALASNMPVAVGFPVFRDFMDLGSHSVYNTLSGTNLGGHTVTAFGYDSEGLILRNERGTSWGNSGDVKVSWSFVQTVMTAAYTVTGITTPDTSITPAPQVTQLSAIKGSAGASVTIVGAELSKATKVTLGARTRASASRSATGSPGLVATAPAHAGGAGSVPVVVVSPGGTSAGKTFAYKTSLTPVITSVAPATGYTTANTTAVLNGRYLTGASIVYSAGKRVSFKRVSDSQFKITLVRRAAGNVALRVRTSSGYSNTIAFRYAAPPAPWSPA